MFDKIYWSIDIELVRNVRFLNSPKVLLIDETGTNVGTIESHIALKKAKESGLDLILVNKATTPPVCRIGNLGKLKYEAEKKKKETKKREPEVKTLKLGPATAKHDLDVVVKKAKEFLERGDKVRLECKFKRREIAFPHLGKANIEYIISELGDLCKVEKTCELVMKTMISIIVPK